MPKGPTYQELEKRIQELEKEIASQEGAKKYHQLFMNSPISLWEEDFSQVKRRIDEIKQEHAGDLGVFFLERPDMVRELAGLVRVIDVNQATLKLYKAKSKKTLLDGITTTFSEQSYRDFIIALTTIAEGRTELFTEKTGLTIDGEPIIVQLHWAVAPGYEKTYGRVLVCIIDITNQKRAETALRDSENFLNSVIESVQDGISILNPDLTIRHTNGVMKRWYKEKLPLAGKHCYQAYHNRDAACPSCPTLRCMQTGRVECEEVPGLPGSEVLWVELFSYPLKNPETGEISGVVEFVRDITRRRQMEKEREKLQHQLHQSQKAESLGRIAGAIAHQFNNLLSVIIGNIDLVQKNHNLDGNALEMLDNCINAARRGADISHLMLTYIGQAAHRRENLDLAKTCRDSLVRVSDDFPETVVLKIDLPDNGPMIHADDAQIKQMISNLLTNAADAITNGPGEISITLEEVQATDIRTHHLYPADGKIATETCACLSISDTGCGIPLENMENIFDPFFSTKLPGRGLGLPAVLGIITAHDGALSIESRQEQGTTFRVFLPVARQKAAARKVPELQASEKTRGLVLVVDDEPALRNLAKAMLGRFGYAVITACDGAEAVAILEKRRDDIGCVLLDLTMPRMNGWKTLSALRKLRSDIPVILCSGYDKEGVMAEEHEQSPQLFLQKPYHMADLKAAMESVFRI